MSKWALECLHISVSSCTILHYTTLQTTCSPFVPYLPLSHSLSLYLSLAGYVSIHLFAPQFLSYSLPPHTCLYISIYLSIYLMTLSIYLSIYLIYLSIYRSYFLPFLSSRLAENTSKSERPDLTAARVVVSGKTKHLL